MSGKIVARIGGGADGKRVISMPLKFFAAYAKTLYRKDPKLQEMQDIVISHEAWEGMSGYDKGDVADAAKMIGRLNRVYTATCSEINSRLAGGYGDHVITFNVGDPIISLLRRLKRLSPTCR